MLVLGIESSCDETAIAVVRDGTSVLSSVVASQVGLHKEFGGVVPEIAARQHLKLLPRVFEQALAQADVTVDQLDGIAVTQGPGLIGAVLVGATFAKGLGFASHKVVVPVDHVHAHIHGALFGISNPDIFPALALVVSGGHTNLYYAASPTEFQLIAYTLDDACGECFDKVGKLLNLPYPGGPHIERLAEEGQRDAIKMPKTVKDQNDLRFSYSGLKTFVANQIRSCGDELDFDFKANLAASFQEEALGQLDRKLRRALQTQPSAKSILVAGGVAANSRLRQRLADIKIPVHFPQPKYCSDNGAMIAAYGTHLLKKFGPEPYSDMGWDAYARYNFKQSLASGPIT